MNQPTMASASPELPPDSPLATLAETLKENFACRPRQLGWSNPEPMRRLREALEQRFGTRSLQNNLARRQRRLQGVMAFRLQKENTSFLHLKAACEGAYEPLDWGKTSLLAQSCLADDAELFLLLQKTIAQQPPKRAAICRKALDRAKNLVNQRDKDDS
ncbi:MAG: hypothetical protein LBL69_01650 [Zoogloeaceae bacterium]|jgi:hypothetical protein|nr:hypothetical protein [Zoogloeaceae bacterium]